MFAVSLFTVFCIPLGTEDCVEDDVILGSIPSVHGIIATAKQRYSHVISEPKKYIYVMVFL